MPATSDVYDIIRQAERKKQHQQEAKLYAEFVKWYFIEVTMDGNQLEEYPNSINLKLEMAYKNQEKDCQRIQNRSLYQQYVAKKKSIDAQNPSTVVNEKMLWHGTAGNAVDSINAYGFNRSYCGKNAVVHGNGVYFAANAAYSCRTTYSPPDPSTGQRHIYQCKVLTGEFAQGQQGMRVPPNKPSTSGAASHILYDSVVDNVNSPGIFVIFNDTQAYPEYHIIFG
ncbi:hypothetical protein KUTeg_002603 [Tegillarca granosa]|uniref:Poly [ADP-ribose] polymerase n=1 Tax=Tegillarca granosa TaxID=220873 RepID=A0ABQ9FWA4_TEGGR|nr:hypothetical protein KUTeg_002603 [Tegillarca granosa]